MSRKAKSQSSSISLSISRWLGKVSTAKPSTFALSAIIIGAAIFFFAGGIYTIVLKPLASVYLGDTFYFLYPELSSQFVFDTVIATLLYSLGFLGLLAMYSSTKQAYNPRQAYMSLILGATLLLLAYVFLEVAINIKLG
jgi:hypothetical protein